MQRVSLVVLALFIAPGALAGTDSALHRAVHEDDESAVRELLRDGFDAATANDYGVTPAHLACKNRSEAIIRLLMDAGASPDAATWNGETVLMSCARTGAADAVAVLLEHGADVNAKEQRDRQTALMWAAAGGHGAVTELLVKHGANVAARSRGGFTPLLFAARSGDVTSTLSLLAGGAEPNESTAKHGSALVVAAAGGHEPLALLLLRHGADPNATDENGIAALHHAVAEGMAALNGVRYDPVYRVVPSNLHALAEALLETGADPDLQIQKGLRLGPDGSPFELEGATAFLLAAVSADTEMIRLLKEHGADPDIVGKGGTTALIAAARAACTGACAFKGGNRANAAEIARAYAAVRTLVEIGANVNAANDEGQTAMHMAAFTGSEAIVRYLAEQGAEVNVMDAYGQTPWSMASGISPVLRYRGLYGYHETTAALLEGLGARRITREQMDPNAPPPPGQ